MLGARRAPQGEDGPVFWQPDEFQEKGQASGTGKAAYGLV